MAGVVSRSASRRLKKSVQSEQSEDTMRYTIKPDSETRWTVALRFTGEMLIFIFLISAIFAAGWVVSDLLGILN